jgi:hypothetical protein
VQEARRFGKALAVDEPVLTPFGWRLIGDLMVGDALCATDGTQTRVIGVYPQGVRALFDVRFSDGAVVRADADHNWLPGGQTKASRKAMSECLASAQRASSRRIR